MPKKKSKSSYNDFVDAEKLTDNSEPRVSLQDSGTQPSGLKSSRPISPPSTSRNPSGPNTRNRKPGEKPKKPQLTHFLCLPLVNRTSEHRLTASLETFKKDVAEMGEKDGKTYVPEKAIRPVGTLHLTLGVMSLDDAAMGAVGHIMENLDLTQLLAQSSGADPSNPTPDPLSLSISLTGLHTMHKPASTSVLYAVPQDLSNRLYAFATKVRDVFAERGVLVKDERKLILHATVLNTVYARGGRGREGKEKAGGKEKGNEAGRQEHAEDNGCSEGTAMTEEGGVHEVPTREGTDIDTALETAEDVGMVGEAGALLQPPISSVATTPKSKPRKKNRRTMPTKLDARPLIEIYKDFVWAEGIQIEKVQVCRIRAKEIVSETGSVVGVAYEGVFEKGF